MLLSPIFIFLFILVVLAFSIIFGESIKSLYVKPEEGFITYRSKTKPGETAILAQYTTERAVYKLYDNFYYDNLNGTVILLKSPEQASTLVDISGTSLTGISLWDRNGATLSDIAPSTPAVPVGKFEHAQSKLASIINTFNQFKIVAENNANKYELLYIPWGQETFIHIIQLPKKTGTLAQHLCTYSYDANGTLVNVGNTANKKVTFNPSADTGVASSTPALETPINQPLFQPDKVLNKSNPNDNAFVKMSKYSTNNTLIQLCKNVRYDYKNGNIVSIAEIDVDTNLNSNKINVYSRPTADTKKLTPITTTVEGGKVITVLNSMLDVPGFTAGAFDTLDKNYTVLYIASGKRSILVSLIATTTNDFDFHNVIRADANGNIVKSATTVYSSGGDTKVVVDPENSEFNYNNYYKFLLYLQGSPDGNLYSMPLTNDYMLKTQIVPPVCPTCPSCPNYKDVCSDCGGKGGAGTQTSGDNNISQLLRDTGSGATNLVKDTGSGAAGLARETVGGTVGLAKEAVGGTVGLAKEAVGGTVGLAKEAVGGTVDLAKEAGTGISNTLGKIQPTIVSSGSDSAYDRENGGSSSNDGRNSRTSSVPTGSDYTSYFGALPAKGGNYIPVTADFSRFGR